MLGKQNTEDVLQYLKRLTPSGVELEVMTLANYSLEGTDNVSKRNNSCRSMPFWISY
jgi:hypothetical protein